MSIAPNEPAAAAPRITVIICTHGRPELVPTAVRSALAQTLPEIEVLVVVDGPDGSTEAALRQFTDPRLRVEVLPENLGLSGARNHGLSLARAPWVATLDDDDEWDPRKLALQLQVAEASRWPNPIIATRFLARYVDREFVWPRRLPRAGEPVSEYIFCQSTPLYGEGILLPTTLLCRRELMLQVPFDLRYRRWQDLDWLLRVSARHDVGVEFVPGSEPLAVWNQLGFEAGRTPRRCAAGWVEFVEWLNERRPTLTRRAYSSALLTWLAPNQVRFGETDSFWPLLQWAFRHGSPRPRDVAMYLAVWLIPPGLKVTLARWYGRWRRAASRGPPKADRRS